MSDTGYGQSPYGRSPFGDPSKTTRRSVRSSFTQDLQNYFDESDVQVREAPYGLEAQLLNLPAGEIERARLRYRNFMNGSVPGKAPLNIDNQGLYISAKIPYDYLYASDSINVEGSRNGVWQAIPPLDPEIPTPISAVEDTSRSRLPLTHPVWAVLNGAGNEQSKTFYPVDCELGEMIYPGQLQFYVQSAFSGAGVVTVLVSGVRYPKSVWDNEEMHTESFRFIGPGLYKTNTVWASVSSIRFTGLPLHSTVFIYRMPFNVLATPDPDRPCYIPESRDQVYNRYWEVDNTRRLLREMYYPNNFSEPSTLFCYTTDGTLRSIAVEPNTFGMFYATASELVYLDRREPLPDNLNSTGITQEPAYGIKVLPNQELDISMRVVDVYPVAYPKSVDTAKFRWIVDSPDGQKKMVLSDGTVYPFSSDMGWSSGTVPSFQVALDIFGSWAFTLETLQKDGSIVRFCHPYQNLQPSEMSRMTIDGVTDIQGIAFDSFDQFWVWDGQEAIPIKFGYDAYILDNDNRQILLTNTFDEIRFV